MGKETKRTQSKTIKGVSGLKYIEVKNVPVTLDKEFGVLFDSRTIERVEKLSAEALILKNLPIRGLEVEFFRGIFALSQREFAQKLGLSHVAIFKWEKAKKRRLDLINEVAVKALISGMLGLRIAASLETLVGLGSVPKRLVLDYSQVSNRSGRQAA